jgi:flavin reductase (DIM6/NTAB) family NADH-FMN oxidoreductase RutF
MDLLSVPYPRQVIVVSSRYNNKDNAMTLSWHSPASFNPALYSIYVSKERFSYNLIKKSKCFCVNFLSKNDGEIALVAGRKSGKDFDKFSVLEKLECEKISCPRLREAVAFLECELVDEFEVGDHVVFVGKVVNSKVLKESKRLFQVKGNEFTTTVV